MFAQRLRTDFNVYAILARLPWRNLFDGDAERVPQGKLLLPISLLIARVPIDG